jgi:hypothetical protein
MTREGHERRPKHCKASSASRSSWAPVAYPKKLAKRKWSISLRENSTPEDSPPRGATPDSPEEFECLKIRALIAHTNREEVNYNKVDPRNAVTFR